MLTLPKCIRTAIHGIAWYFGKGNEENRNVVLMTDVIEQEETLRVLFSVIGTRIQENKRRRHYQVITAQDWWGKDPDKLPRVSIELNLMLEELGEMAAAYNRNRIYDFKEEMADLMILLVGVAKGLDLDLAKAVYQKMEKNETRSVSGEKRF